MRAVYVDAGNDPDYAKLARHGITMPYLALTDPRVTQQYLAHVLTHDGITGVGVYAASTWWPQLPGKDFAGQVANLVKPLRLSNTVPRVQLDDENHDPSRIVDELNAWRQLMPQQATSWTLEPFQGGWFTKTLVGAIVGNRIRVAPQLYWGDFHDPPPAADRVVLELAEEAVPPTSITCVYDAAHLPDRWNGWAFEMGRLP